MARLNLRKTRRVWLVALLAAAIGVPVWGDYPPLSTEISADHPLFLFEAPEPGTTDVAAYGAAIVQLWADLDADLKPFAVMKIKLSGSDPASRQNQAQTLLQTLQEADVPTAIELTDGDLRTIYPLDLAEDLVKQFTSVKGIVVRGLDFNTYSTWGGGELLGMPPTERWLIGAIDLAARYGRFISIHLQGLNWARVMANGSCDPLYDKIATCKDYVVPIAVYRGGHAVQAVSSAMGLWLEGGATHWGVEAQSRWYTDARFISPGLFGVPDDASKVPPSVYRAMILNGAMTGATAYSFAPWTDLWYGLEKRHWEQAIRPTLKELVENGYIAPPGQVEKKVRVAYQMAPAKTSQDFHLDLRDLDADIDEGFLPRGAYGMEYPGMIPELILDTGRYFWVPFLSPHRTADRGAAFDYVVQPGAMTSPEQWQELLNKYYAPEGQGTAFISYVGRCVFVMNTKENEYEAQSFYLPELPAPVRRLSAQRENDTVVLSWPFREGDVSYRIYKRVFPSTEFQLLAKGVEERRFVDTKSDPYETAAYAVTALTNETEPYQGVVNYGDYLMLGLVESRIDEEAIISPLTPVAESRVIVRAEDTRPTTQIWWPTYDGVTDEEMPAAKAIVERLEGWRQAFRKKSLDGVLDLYSVDYEDPQGWKFQYVRRAYQWFFERYAACKMAHQIREWDFSAYATSGRVNVKLYCLLMGNAVTDTSGRLADQQVFVPRSNNGEIWISFTNTDGVWRIIRTNPALPNFRDILSWSTGPFDAFRPGPDY